MCINYIFTFSGKKNIVKTVRNFFQSIIKFFVRFDIDMNTNKMLLFDLSNKKINMRGELKKKGETLDFSFILNLDDQIDKYISPEVAI